MVTFPARPDAESEATERTTVQCLPLRAVVEQRVPDRRPAARRSSRIDSAASSDSVEVSLMAFPVRALPERLSAPRTGAEFAAPAPGAGPPGAPVIAADADATSSAEDAPGVDDATVAAAASDPAAAALSTIVTVTCAPAATVPSWHRTALVQLPAEATAATTSAAPDVATSRVPASAGSKPVLVTVAMYVTSPPGATSVRDCASATPMFEESSTAPMSQPAPVGAGAPR